MWVSVRSRATPSNACSVCRCSTNLRCARATDACTAAAVAAAAGFQLCHQLPLKLKVQGLAAAGGWMAGRRRRRGAARRWPTPSWRLRRSLHLRRTVRKRVAAAVTCEASARTVLASARTALCCDCKRWPWQAAQALVTGGPTHRWCQAELWVDGHLQCGKCGGRRPPWRWRPTGSARLRRRRRRRRCGAAAAARTGVGRMQRVEVGVVAHQVDGWVHGCEGCGARSKAGVGCSEQRAAAASERRRQGAGLLAGQCCAAPPHTGMRERLDEGCQAAQRHWQGRTAGGRAAGGRAALAP